MQNTQQYTFVKTDTGWFMCLSDTHDIEVWDKNFNRRLYEKAAANLMEGKEYKNQGMNHGPYIKAAPLSDYAYLLAQNDTSIYTKSMHPAALALAKLHEIRHNLIKTMKREVTQHPVYVNRTGGYNVNIKETDITETIYANDFPTENRKESL